MYLNFSFDYILILDLYDIYGFNFFGWILSCDFMK